MAVIGGGISGYVERTILLSFFSATSYTPPATVYAGLATNQPLDVSNFGASVTYGSSSLVDSQNFFPYNLTGAWVIAGGSTGQVSSNTTSTIALTGAWTGGTPAAGTQYDIAYFSEPSGNNYSRVALTNNSTNFVLTPTSGSVTTYSGGVTFTGSAINFPSSSGAGWGHIVSVFLADSSTVGEGHILGAQPLATPQFVLGGQSITVPLGALGLGLK